MSLGDLSLAGPRNQAVVKLPKALGQSVRPQGVAMSAAQPPSVPATRQAATVPPVYPAPSPTLPAAFAVPEEAVPIYSLLGCYVTTPHGNVDLGCLLEDDQKTGDDGPTRGNELAVLSVRSKCA